MKGIGEMISIFNHRGCWCDYRWLNSRNYYSNELSHLRDRRIFPILQFIPLPEFDCQLRQLIIEECIMGCPTGSMVNAWQILKYRENNPDLEIIL